MRSFGEEDPDFEDYVVEIGEGMESCMEMGVGEFRCAVERWMVQLGDIAQVGDTVSIRKIFVAVDRLLEKEEATEGAGVGEVQRP